MTQIERYRRQVGIWLLGMSAQVLSMIVLGGMTRLTDSGLSMVEWKPIMGSLPPLNQDDWTIAFEKYQQYPEYQKLNQGMSLSDFKQIFFFEYSHRMLGRFIGLAFAVPFVFFWLKKAISKKMLPSLLILFILGGAQGLIGWWMVKSGLVDRPDVSHYRLTVHLSMAFLLYIALLWTGLTTIRGAPKTTRYHRLGRFGIILLLLAYLTILSGGLVAGLNAGAQFNTFPKMAGEWIPAGLFILKPWYLNFTENLMTVQFDHRLLAITTFTLSLLFFKLSRNAETSKNIKRAFFGMVLALCLQVTLGITTLLTVVWIPVALAHQSGAVIFMSSIIWVLFELYYPPLVEIVDN